MTADQMVEKMNLMEDDDMTIKFGWTIWPSKARRAWCIIEEIGESYGEGWCLEDAFEAALLSRQSFNDALADQHK